MPKTHYQYGMRFRGPGPGTMPKVRPREIINTNKADSGFFAILVYDQPLSEEDIYEYELVDLNKQKSVDYRKKLMELTRKNKNIPRDPAIKEMIKRQRYEDAYSLALRFKGSVPLQLTLYRKGLHSKGVFTDGARYYKSNETSGHNGPSGTSTKEFELITRASRILKSKNIIRIGKTLLASNVGQVFEIEFLKPATKLSLPQLIVIQDVVRKLNAQRIRISDEIQVMLRGNVPVLTDLSSGYRGSGDDSDYIENLFRRYGHGDYLKYQTLIDDIKAITGMQVSFQDVRKIAQELRAEGIGIEDVYFYEDELIDIVNQFYGKH